MTICKVNQSINHLILPVFNYLIVTLDLLSGRCVVMLYDYLQIYNIYNIYMVYIILNFIIKNNKDNNGQSAGNQSIYERKYMSRILRDYTWWILK